MKAAQERITQFLFSLSRSLYSTGNKKKEIKKRSNEKKPCRWLAVFNKSSLYLLLVARARLRLRFSQLKTAAGSCFIGHNVSSSGGAAYSTGSVTQRRVITENKAEKNETVLLLPLFLKNV